MVPSLTIRLISLDAPGLGEAEKMSVVMRWPVEQRVDMAAICETHITRSCAENINIDKEAVRGS